MRTPQGLDEEIECLESVPVFHHTTPQVRQGPQTRGLPSASVLTPNMRLVARPVVERV